MVETVRADGRGPWAELAAPGRPAERSKVPGPPGRREARRRGARRACKGSVPARLVVGVGVLALLGLTAFTAWSLWGEVDRSGDARDSAAIAPERERTAPARETRVEGAAAGQRHAAQAPADPTELAARPPSAADFRGRGAIRGTLVLAPGIEAPSTWTVVVGPSRSLTGRERAESRRAEFSGAGTEFELLDLPLGGYDLRVEAPGLDSHPVPVLLVRGSEQAFVNVAVHRRGILDGFLLDGEGAPLEGIQVVLEDETSGERRTTLSTATGSYAFTNLPDSEYRIYFGGATQPLIPREELSFRAPSMRYPVRHMPAMGALRLRIIDPEGNPIAGATIHGFSPNGGLIETVTDELGLARAANLRPGRYRIAARHAATDREGRITLDVDAGPEEPATIALVPARE